jgi:IS605 OrfB family transposase
MTRTFCAVIEDERADALLSPYGEVMARARHWSFKQIHALGRDVTSVKKEAQRKFGLTARQFNGVRFDLDQAVNAWRGTAKFRVTNLKDSIEATVERIAGLGRQMEKARTEKRLIKLQFVRVGKKQRLDVLKGRLGVAEAELRVDRPRICFGGRDLLRKDEVWAWREKRNTRIFLVGSKSEVPNGNQSVHWDGAALSLRMPDSLGGGVQRLDGVRFRYGQAELLRLLERNRDKTSRVGMTWLIFRAEDGRWHAHVTVDGPVAEVVTDIRHGVIAVDVNVGHLAVTIVDHFGNPTSRLTLGFPDSNVDEGRAAVIIGDTVRALCLLAKSRSYGIAVEDLEFSRKKAGLREYGTAHARRLSGWAYAKLFQVLQARCARDGVDLCKVNPAFTSVIGRTKYARGRAMSTHHAAALVIGRRAQGYGERLVTMDGVTLGGPARNRPRSEWRRWRGVRRLPREGQKPVRTAGLGVGIAERGGRQRPASATGDPAFGRVAASGQRTRTVPLQVRGAVAQAADSVSPSG